MKETLKNLDSRTSFSDQKFLTTFKKYDKDNSNELDKKELSKLVKDMVNIDKSMRTA
jgi:Ca2+-binding EF-hand superfamily protein